MARAELSRLCISPLGAQTYTRARDITQTLNIEDYNHAHTLDIDNGLNDDQVAERSHVLAQGRETNFLEFALLHKRGFVLEKRLQQLRR